MTRASSLASMSIDRTGEYGVKPQVRKEPAFSARFLRGVALQEEMRRRWATRPEQRTNPDEATENRA